eukprot:GEMP01007202.1.p1 GENE.GEMP01007202.1~~GEMP01007202.1.p1  ORF type:complete len:894 (+),score=178.15 GEMP01007202.1:174-2855(+)
MTHLVRRFNPLVLAENEDYIHDFAATLSQTANGDPIKDGAPQRGRLRVCSKSLIFDPEHGLAPLLKFPYMNIQRLQQTNRGMLWVSDKAVEVRVRRLEGKTRVVEPYVTKKDDVRNCWLLEPDFADVGAEFGRIEQLWDLRGNPNPEVVRQLIASTQTAEFDVTRLNHREGPPLLPTSLPCSRVKPLIRHRGLVQVTREAIYFQPVPNFSTKRAVRRIVVDDILLVFDRTLGLNDTGLEIIDVNRGALYLCFESRKDRDLVRNHLPEANAKNSDSEVKRMMALWQTGKISNYSYLDFLNCAAGRSINDMSQYPVFPWILKDFESEELDLSKPSTFRDLSKPLGAMNEKRLHQYRERMHGLEPEERFLYGTHYSTPAYSLFYLLRCLPECMLRLHCGHFDGWSRLFHSIRGAWEATQASQALMELIPEFFACDRYGDRWLTNELQIQIQEGELGSVELPKWAKGSTKKFIKMHRAALESEYVSRHLPAWIDLIFGYKSRGEEAEKADNLYHPVCYLTPPVSPDLSPRSASVLETQIEEFGRCPNQIFKEPHPPRLKHPKWDGESSASCWYMLRRAQSNILSTAEADVPDTEKNLTGIIASLGPISPAAQLGPSLATWKGTESVDYLDGQVYGVGQDGSLKVLEVSSARVRTFRASNVPLKAIKVIEPQLVALAGCDNTVAVFSTQSGSTLDAQLLHADSVTTLAYAKHSDLLVSGSLDQMVCVWQLTNSYLHVVTNFDTQQSVYASTIGVDVHSNVVFAGCDAGGVFGWDIRSNNLIFEHYEGAEMVCNLAVNARSCMACTRDGTLTMWDLRKDVQLCQFSVDRSFSKVQCMLSDAQTWAMIGGEGIDGMPQLSLWDLLDFRERKAFGPFDAPVVCLTQDVLILCADGDVRFLR